MRPLVWPVECGRAKSSRSHGTPPEVYGRSRTGSNRAAGRFSSTAAVPGSVVHRQRIHPAGRRRTRHLSEAWEPDHSRRRPAPVHPHTGHRGGGAGRPRRLAAAAAASGRARVRATAEALAPRPPRRRPGRRPRPAGPGASRRHHHVRRPARRPRRRRGHHGTFRTTYEPVRATVRVGAIVPAGTQIGRLSAAGTHCAPQACLHWGLLRGDHLPRPAHPPELPPGPPAPPAPTTDANSQATQHPPPTAQPADLRRRPGRGNHRTSTTNRPRRYAPQQPSGPQYEAWSVVVGIAAALTSAARSSSGATDEHHPALQPRCSPSPPPHTCVGLTRFCAGVTRTARTHALLCRVTPTCAGLTPLCRTHAHLRGVSCPGTRACQASSSRERRSTPAGSLPLARSVERGVLQHVPQARPGRDPDPLQHDRPLVVVDALRPDPGDAHDRPVDRAHHVGDRDLVRVDARASTRRTAPAGSTAPRPGAGRRGCPAGSRAGCPGHG